MAAKQQKGQKRSLLVYLVLALGITWLCWIPGLVIGSRQGYLMPNFNTYGILLESGFANTQHLLLGILFQLGVFGPLVGALVATRLDGGRDGLADLWGKITRWEIQGKWYLTALGIAFLMAAIPVAIFGSAAGFTPAGVGFGFLAAVLLAQIFTSGLGEEPGWRGYLLPRLKGRLSGDKYIWVLGLIWAVWHYPLVILQTPSQVPGLTALQTGVMILTSLAGMTMSQIGITFLYAWLYNQTNSVFLMILFHALSNLLSSWLVLFLPAPGSVTLFIALMPWLIVVFLQKRLGPANFPG